MAPVRILIADDHPLVRSGLRALLGAAEDMEVVGEATTGEEAVTLAASLQPEVIVMDLRMPGINGIEATRRIVQANQQIRILVVTLFNIYDKIVSNRTNRILKINRFDLLGVVFNPCCLIRKIDAGICIGKKLILCFSELIPEVSK